jgi:four helix bundle protein
MFSQLNHKSLNVYKALRELVKECYLLTRSLPPSEQSNLLSHIRRAALSVKLNIAEGSSRRSEAERKRLYEIARGSVIEIDAAIETALDLEFFTFKEATNVRVL